MIHQLNGDCRGIDEVARRVHLTISEHCTGDCCAVASSLEHCAEEAVAALWMNPVKIYIPLLAYRHVQDCIRQGHCSPQQEMSWA